MAQEKGGPCELDLCVKEKQRGEGRGQWGIVLGFGAYIFRHGKLEKWDVWEN